MMDLTFSTETVKHTALEFHEIHEKLNSEIPQELEFQIKNVLLVIEMAIEKLKISLILPQIFENPKVLHQHLKNVEYENCLKLVQEFRKKRIVESLEEPSYTDYHLLQIIEYFQENHSILKVLPNWLDNIDNTEKALLKAFQDVYHVAKERFNRLAMADLAKEKRLHEVYLANENVKNDIKATRWRIQNKKINRFWKKAAKIGVMKNLEDELTFHQYDYNTFVRKESIKSNREIQKSNNMFSNKQRDLEEELEKSRIAYEEKLKVDLIQERRVQDEKNKLQLQLQALIDKYDQTILDKYKEEICLQDEYDRQKQEFDEFLIEFKREEVIYEEVVLKKERQNKRLHEAKILLYTQMRAAKKIQRWWLEYLHTKKLKQMETTKVKKSKGRKAKSLVNEKKLKVDIN